MLKFASEFQSLDELKLYKANGDVEFSVWS